MYRYTIIIACITLLLNPPTSSAKRVIWEYNLNSGYPVGWSITHGQAEVNDGILNVTDCIETNVMNTCMTSMWVDSTTDTGSWYFRYFPFDTEKSNLVVYFAGEGVSGTLDEIENSSPFKGYCLNIFNNHTHEDHGQHELQFGMQTSPASGCIGSSIPDFELSEAWHDFQISRNETGAMTLYIDGEYIISTEQTVDDFTPEHANIQLSGNDKLDYFTLLEEIKETRVYSDNQVLLSEPQNSAENSLPWVGLITVGLVSVSVIATGSVLYVRKRQIAKINKKNQSIIRRTSKSFELNETSLSSLIGGGVEKGDKVETPPELLRYRYLMHPIRLTIMKSLYLNEFELSSDIRSSLGISWGEYRTHLKSLEQKGYVKIKETFDHNSNLVQMIEITSSGSQEYQILFDLLSNFVEKHSPLDHFINGIHYSPTDDLYPESD